MGSFFARETRPLLNDLPADHPLNNSMITCMHPRRSIPLLFVSLAVAVTPAAGCDPDMVRAEVSVSLSDEITVDPNPVPGSAHNDQVWPRAMFDGSQYLVSWFDNRNIPIMGHRNKLIFGTRLTPQGKVLDPTGLMISDQGYYEGPLRLGSGLTVLRIKDGRVRIFPLSKQGLPLKQVGLTTTLPGFVPGSISVVGSDGKGLLVAYTVKDAASGMEDIWIVRLDATGRLLTTKPRQISTTQGQTRPARVTWDGSSYLLTWLEHDYNGKSYLIGCLVSRGGTPQCGKGGVALTPPDHDKVCTSAAAPAAGGGFLVAWDNGFSTLTAARLDASGKLLDKKGITLKEKKAVGCYFPSLALGGKTHLVAWQETTQTSSYGERDQLFVRRLDPGGKLLDAAPIPVATDTSNHEAPWIAFDGTNFLVVMSSEEARTDHLVYNADIRAVRVSPMGAVLDKPPLLLSSTANSQFAPAAARVGDDFTIVWRDDRTPQNTLDLYAARVSRQGKALGAGAVPLFKGKGRAGIPSLVGGSQQGLLAGLVVQGNAATVLAGSRVDTAGGALDAPPVTLTSFKKATTNWNRPAVASGGDAGYLVVWDGDMGTVEALRVSRAGKALDPAPLVLTKTGGGPAVAHDGSNYLVVWITKITDKNASILSTQLRGVRVTSQGKVLEASPLLLAAAFRQDPPAVDFDGQDFLVVWSQYSTSAKSGDPEPFTLHGIRVSPGGRVLDGGGFSVLSLAAIPGARFMREPQLVFDGEYHVLAFDLEFKDWMLELWGVLLDSSGRPLSRPFTIATSTYISNTLRCALAADTRGRSLVAYHRLFPDSPLGANRVAARIISHTTTQPLPSRGCDLSGARGESPRGLLVLLLVLGLVLFRRTQR